MNMDMNQELELSLEIATARREWRPKQVALLDRITHAAVAYRLERDELRSRISLIRQATDCLYSFVFGSMKPTGAYRLADLISEVKALRAEIASNYQYALADQDVAINRAAACLGSLSLRDMVAEARREQEEHVNRSLYVIHSTVSQANRDEGGRLGRVAQALAGIHSLLRRDA